MDFFGGFNGDLFLDWLTPVAILTLTLALANIARSILRYSSRKYLSHNRTWKFISNLAPTLSNLLYIAGFRAAIAWTPVSPAVRASLESAVFVFAVLLLLSLLRKAALLGVEWWAMRSSPNLTLEEGFIPLLRNMITLFVFLTGGIMILKHFNYDVMSLMTALGVGSLAVGLAAKETLSNMISGFTLIIDRNLKPGDRVNLGGTVGSVGEIGLRSTRIRTSDGNTLIVPNSELVNTKLLNLSNPSAEVCCVSRLRFHYGVPFQRVQEICLQTLKEVPFARSEPKQAVHLSSLGDGFQGINVKFWVSAPEDQDAALSDFNIKLLARLSRENISLVPTP